MYGFRVRVRRWGTQNQEGWVSILRQVNLPCYRLLVLLAPLR